MPRMSRRLTLLLPALLIGLMHSSIASAEDAIKVVKNKPVVEYKQFDPKNLPDPPPPLGPGEAAVTEYRFAINSDGRFSYQGPDNPANGSNKYEVKIERISLTLDLKVTIWLPKNCPKSLEAHEDGHLKIAEAFYADADKTARLLALKVIGTKTTGEGKDIASAGSAAMEKVNQKLLDDYLDKVQKQCETAQEAFDRMTAHGTKKEPAAKEAVPMAIKEGKEKKGK
jgi:hypothetical protein